MQHLAHEATAAVSPDMPMNGVVLLPFGVCHTCWSYVERLLLCVLHASPQCGSKVSDGAVEAVVLPGLPMG